MGDTLGLIAYFPSIILLTKLVAAHGGLLRKLTLGGRPRQAPPPRTRVGMRPRLALYQGKTYLTEPPTHECLSGSKSHFFPFSV